MPAEAVCPPGPGIPTAALTLGSCLMRTPPFPFADRTVTRAPGSGALPTKGAEAEGMEINEGAAWRFQLPSWNPG